MSWSAFGELLGFISSGVLLWPALSLNSRLKKIDHAQATLEKVKTDVFQGKDHGKKTLDNARAPRWSPLDQFLLIAGVATFGASSLIKFFIAIGVIQGA